MRADYLDSRSDNASPVQEASNCSKQTVARLRSWYRHVRHGDDRDHTYGIETGILRMCVGPGAGARDVRSGGIEREPFDVEQIDGACRSAERPYAEAIDLIEGRARPVRAQIEQSFVRMKRFDRPASGVCEFFGVLSIANAPDVGRKCRQLIDPAGLRRPLLRKRRVVR
jgi:hypothetical protein